MNNKYDKELIEARDKVWDELSRKDREVWEHYTMKYTSLEKKHMGFLKEFRAWAFFYPDKFYSLMAKLDGKKFEFDPDQAISMRAMNRYRMGYTAIKNRRAGKTFETIAVATLNCIIFPNYSVQYSALTKKNSSKILNEKIIELINMFSFLKDEIIKHNHDSEDTLITFANGSKMSNTTPESSRGTTTTGEIILDERMFTPTKVLEDTIIPTLTPRKNLKDLKPDRFIVPSTKSISSAGYYNSSGHHSLKKSYETMANLNSGVFSIAHNHQVPLVFGNRGLSKRQLANKKDTISKIAWDMNYETIFAGGSGNSIISIDQLERAKTISEAEFSRSKDLGKDEFYMLSVDWARSNNSKNDNSVCSVGRVAVNSNNQVQSVSIVNMIPIPNTDTQQQQVLKLKIIDDLFNPRYIVIDAHVMGRNFLDGMAERHLGDDGSDYLPFFAYNINEKIPKDVKNYKQHVFSIHGTTEQQHQIALSVINMFEKNKVRILNGSQVDYSEVDKDKFLTKELPSFMANEFVIEALNIESKTVGKFKNKFTFNQSNSNIKKDIFMTVAYMCYFVENHLEKKRETGNKKKYLGLVGRGKM